MIRRFLSDSLNSSSLQTVELVSGRALIWLIAGFVLLLIPQWDRLPIWLVASCAVLAGWRWLAQSGRVRLPGRWMRTGIMLILVAVYIATVQGRFTVDTAASFFVLAVGLKWLETRSTRDFYVLFFILVYLATVNFLFHQEIHWSVINIAGVALLLIGLQVVNAPDIPGAMKKGWRRLGLMLVKTLPIVVLLFVFFPRMSPLWSVPLVSGEARTGISDTMTPGDISSLAQSSERAFRVTFGGELPAYRDRYWRGLILDRLDGDTWQQGFGKPFRRLGRVDVDGGVGPLGPDQYDVLLEPTDQTWAFALADSRAVSNNVRQTNEDLFRFDRPADSSIRYRMELVRKPPTEGASAEPDNLQRYLQLPQSGNPRARAFGQQLAGEHDNPQAVVQRLLTRFREQAYFYTLRPPAMPVDGIDSLLFDEKRGFCAHYAGAMTFVLRAAGIPARVVVGYQGGSPGADNEYLIVRQYDAHAWVEAWFPGQGWVRVDPTAAIAPERIEFGLREAVAEEGSFLENDWASPQRYGDLAVLQWASLQLDKINYHWQRWVVGYQGQSQMNLMSRLPGGIGMRELGYITAGIVGAALLLAGLVTAWQYRRVESRHPIGRLVNRWYRLCDRAGVPVRHGETPAQLAFRLAQAKPAAAGTATAFARLINKHYYGRDSETGHHGELAKMKRLLATMKRQADRPSTSSSKG
ncbi:transglutaminaseTgpA domain-containing protein [Marinobacter algicola]|uniref:Transglutaminase-like enzyme, putative cysteine protease n=1 Tax=Marinobacter algicola DG893 TaxID=443152 RepID=A6EX44_9GAMM|nr:transglutaminaseTgpA domain-containing protein [Marinobacter algicola]EDM49058.1 Transglutaminase-like enzyme, putative cysteine protease [Marinobacter algicola DG893]